MSKQTGSRAAQNEPTTKIIELYGLSTSRNGVDWQKPIESQTCPYIGRKCVKNRKSAAKLTIGSCTVEHSDKHIVICPIRLRATNQIFLDCMHLLALHEPGNELHAIPEISVPGGSLDFVLASVRDGKVKDFVGIELQTVDTTGTVWPERQRFLESVGLPAMKKDTRSAEGFGMNWKMSAKTILMQLHHKVETFEHLNKRIALVVQDHFLDYMEREFSFDHLSNPARRGDALHFHSYTFVEEPAGNRLSMAARKSTDVAGLATALALQVSAKVELKVIVAALKSKLSPQTMLSITPK